jgi:hypothetical protein
MKPALLLALTLIACTPVAPPAAPVQADLAAALVDRAGAGPPLQPPGACWHAAVTPAVIETVTEQVMVTPERRAADGTITAPAAFRSETRQRIVQDRREVWFQTPCPLDLTVGFVATLQRALKARGLYLDAVTGSYDAATAAAVRAWQQPRGLDSDVLAIASARALGIVATEFPGR